MSKKRKYQIFEDVTVVQQLQLKSKLRGQKVTSTLVAAPRSRPEPAVEHEAPPPNPSKEGAIWQDWVEIPSENVDADSDPTTEPSGSKNKFSTSYYLRFWKDNRSRIHLQRLLDMEQRPNEKCIASGCKGLGIYKCHTCLGCPVYCQSCCVENHTRLPFHRISEWNGSFFMPTWLIETGLVVPTGHGGFPCPNNPPITSSALSTLPSSSKAENHTKHNDAFYYPSTRGATHQAREGETILTVVDTAAVHQIRVCWCKCENADTRDLQLFELGLFPFSFDIPHSAMTFQALDEVRLTNLECNTPVSRWYSKVSRSTNPAFPFMVKDRHKEVARTERIWRHLSQLMVYGFGHMNKQPSEGELADFCVACPQPGFNLPANWPEDPQQWKYCRNIVVDGNFSADHVRVQTIDDVELCDGTGYMATTAMFANHMETAKTRNRHPTCHEHKAAMHTSSSKKHLDVTGVCGAACSRHGCWVPGSMVNFSKGEAQPPVDYSVDRAFKYKSSGLENYMLLYDINCQYSVHHKWRFENSPHIGFPETLKNLRYGIGLFHVHGHIDECEFRYSPTYLPGAGRISGEIIETLWEPLNPIAASTRVSSHALRREVIDDHMADSNQKKEYKIVDATLIKYNKTVDDVKDATTAFEDLSSNLSQQQIAAYTQAEAEAQQRRDDDVKAMDIYAVQMEKAPTAATILSNLIRTEMEEPQCSHIGAADWISEGLKIEADMLALKAHVTRMARVPTEKQLADLTRRRQRLQTRIELFNEKAQRYVRKNTAITPGDEAVDSPAKGMWQIDEEKEFVDPDLGQDNEDENGGIPLQESMGGAPIQPEDTVLSLPSNVEWTSSSQFSSDVRAIESELRQGVLNNSIHGMRLAIADKSVLYRTQVRSAKSQATKTRAWAHIRRVQQELDQHRRIYNHSRRAYINLGASEDDLRIYRVLKPVDLRASTAIVKPNASGQRDVKLSWIWSTNTGHQNEESKWLEEVYRVGWLKAKARRDRALEELHVLRYEMDWIINGFQAKEDRWMRLADDAATESQPGHVCFAKRQASLARAYKQRAINVFGERRASIQGVAYSDSVDV